MIIVADSGSTKCDFLILNKKWDIVSHLTTKGYNPYFHSEHFIAADLESYAFIQEISDKVQEVFFYGAGCSSPSMIDIVFKALAKVFPNADITVDHDIMASALATYKGEPIISCILGTGSNSSFFDGEKLIQGNLPLGYIVGDEASGCYFGKILLNDFFYNNLPADLHRAFQQRYNLSHASFTDRVYNDDRANVFLASFTQFLIDNRQHAYVQKLLKFGFTEFIEKQILCYEDYHLYEVNFVGSVAYFFQEEIIEVGEEFNLNIGDFVQKPVFKLIEYQKSCAILK